MSDASACACIRCGYDLSGQVAAWTDRCPLHGVCPECGLGLRWDEVLVPAKIAPGWSIEHSSRPGLAALRGLLRGCTPWRLWGWRPGRLSMGVDLRPEIRQGTGPVNRQLNGFEQSFRQEGRFAQAPGAIQTDVTN